MQKNAKIHPKTLQKINKELNNNNIINNITNNNTNNSNNSNNTINTINNTTVNIKFGNENLSNLLSEKEMLKIVNKCRYSVEESIKLVHFNDNRPEYKNVLITNLQNNIAYIFDGNKFIAQNKDIILNELFDSHFGNIESYMLNDDIITKLNNDILYKYLTKFINEINKDEKNKDYKNGYKFFKLNEIKTFVYNNTDSKLLKN